MIKNYNSSDIVIQGASKFKDCKRKDQFFIALAAPSLTGKTQIAFTIKSKLPLYFAFFRSQDIYKNFSSLSISLVSLASIDIEKFKVSTSEPVTLFQISENVNLPLESLGFLFALMKDFKARNADSNPSLRVWMDFFSNINVERSSKFKPLSIYDLYLDPDFKTLIKTFYVFLDEFSGTRELIFLRNLCRSIGLTCIVASTDPKVVDLIGLRSISGSRVAGPSLWSVVVPKLPFISLQNLKNNSELNDGLNRLISLAKDSDKIKMHRLTEYLIEQCCKSRPGFFTFIIDSLSSFCLDFESIGSVSVDDFLIYLIRNTSSLTESRKSSLFIDLQGMRSNLMLMIGGYFNEKYIDDHMMPTSDYAIDEHFFYLKNPYNAGIKPFLLFRKHNRYTPYYYDNAIHDLKDYAPQSYFNLEEELLMMACLFRPMNCSILRLFSPNDLKTQVKDIPNIKASRLSGIVLESVAIGTIVESSHYTYVERSGSLKGVPLTNFLSNILENLDSDCEISRDKRPDISVTHKPELNEFMNSITVPFLFPANSKIPLIFAKVFSPESNSSLRFGECKRTSDQEEIDACFDIFDERNSEKALAVVECKNRKNTLSPSLIMGNIEKALNFVKNHGEGGKSCKLQLTFCQSLASFDHSNTKCSKLEAYSSKNRINILCFKYKEDKFELESVSKAFKLHNDPSMVVVIIELRNLQKHLNQIQKVISAKKPGFINNFK